MSSRVGLRFLANSRAAFRNLRQNVSNNKGFRFSSTEASAAGAEQSQNAFQRMWNSPWSLVIAGISDLARPAEKLSLTQNLALVATGTIWTRWCFVITPKNMLLAAVNFFLACTGAAQLTRIFLWRRSQDGSAKEAVKDMAVDTVESAKLVTDGAKGAVKAAEEKFKSS
uniref:Mitochondrial pyruvate carrier n=1 Tax=Talaromyces marneffei PM1 TaxID=1077442 RepID=A0A093XUS9_TALMA